MGDSELVIFRLKQLIAIILGEDTFKCCEVQISEAGRDPCFQSLQPLRHCVQPQIYLYPRPRHVGSVLNFSNKTIQVYDLSFFTPTFKQSLI